MPKCVSIQVKSVGGSPLLQTKTVTPSVSTQYITPSTRYDGLNQVTVNRDNNLIAENIKSRISIFGVNRSIEERYKYSTSFYRQDNISQVFTLSFYKEKISEVISFDLYTGLPPNAKSGAVVLKNINSYSIEMSTNEINFQNIIFINEDQKEVSTDDSFTARITIINNGGALGGDAIKIDFSSTSYVYGDVYFGTISYHYKIVYK